MDTRKEMSGACPLGSRQIYVSPEVESVDLELKEIIAVSAGSIDINDPWTGTGEEEL